MAALITLAEAKTQLRITSDAHDADIELKRVQASEIVVDYLKGNADESWTDANVPGVVKAAILIQLTVLFDREDVGIPQGVKDILARKHKPTVV